LLPNALCACTKFHTPFNMVYSRWLCTKGHQNILSIFEHVWVVP
jgi:hypothetical protein